MAITRKDIKKAISEYLPSDLNYAQDSSGNVDSDALFKRLSQMVAVALAIDPDALTYIVYLSVQRLTESLSTIVSLLDELAGDQQLLSADSTGPVQITDFTQLIAARNYLTAMESDLATGGDFSEARLASFTKEIDGFLEDQLKQNVENKNTAAVDALLVASISSIETAWAEMLTQRELVFNIVDEFFDVDVKGLAAQLVLNSASTSLTSSHGALKDATAQDQGTASDEILISIAAIKAVLNIIENAPEVAGTVTITPAQSEGEGFLPKTNVEVVGEGDVIPSEFIAKSVAGRHFLGYTVGGTLGYTDSADEPRAVIECSEGPYTLSGAVLSLSFTYTIEDPLKGFSDPTTIIETWDTDATTYTASEVADLLHLTEVDFEVNDAGTGLVIATASSDRQFSTLVVNETTSAEFLEVFGLLAGLKARGSSLTTTFRDEYIDGSTSARHWAEYVGLPSEDTGTLADTHDESYFLCPKVGGQSYPIVAVGEDGDGPYLTLGKGVQENWGTAADGYSGSSDTDIYASQWIITKGRSLGAYIYSNGQVRASASAGAPHGKLLSSGTHWVDKGRDSGGDYTGSVPTSVLRVPDISGSLFNGLGLLGMVIPRVKCEGEAKNCYDTGTKGHSAPYESTGTSGIARKAKVWGTSGTHGKHASYGPTTTGQIAIHSSEGYYGFYSGTTGLPGDHDPGPGDYLYLESQDGSAAIDDISADATNTPLGFSYRIHPVDETTDVITEAAHGAVGEGDCYMILNPDYLVDGTGSDPGSSATQTFQWQTTWYGLTSGATYNEISFTWIDPGHFHTNLWQGFVYGNDEGISALPGDYLILGDPLGTGSNDPLRSTPTAVIFEVLYAETDRGLKLWDKSSFEPAYHADALPDPDHPGNSHYGYLFGNFYKEKSAEIDHMWGIRGSGAGVGTAAPRGADVQGRQTGLNWWLMQRGTIGYEFNLPDWWGAGEITSVVDVYGNLPSNDHAWSFGIPAASTTKWIADGKIAIGDKLTITEVGNTVFCGSSGRTYLIDDWYIYAIGDDHRISIAKEESGYAATPRYFGKNCTWRITREGHESMFRDVDAQFITNGVETGMTLRIANGVNAGIYTIASIDSETQVTITGTFPTMNITNSDWYVLAGARVVISSECLFQSSQVEAGDIVRIHNNDTGALISPSSGDEWEVHAVIDDSRIVLTEDINISDRNFTGASLHVRPKADDDSESSTYGEEVSNVFLQLDRHFLGTVNFKSFNTEFPEIGTTMEDADGNDVITTLRLEAYGGSSGFTDVGVVSLGSTTACGVWDDYASQVFIDFSDTSAMATLSSTTCSLTMDTMLKVDGLIDESISSGNRLYWQPYAVNDFGLGKQCGFILAVDNIFFDLSVPNSVQEIADGFCLWSLFAGTTNSVFLDTEFSFTASPGFSAGDLLTVNPGESNEETAQISTVINHSAMTLVSALDADSETDIDTIRQGIDGIAAPNSSSVVFDPGNYYPSAGLGSSADANFGRGELRYTVIPSAWPSPGDEVVVGGYRIPIISISEVTNKTDTQVVLELKRELPLSLGKDFTFYVVTPGGDPYSIYFSDDAPRDGDGLTLADGFSDSSVEIIGKEIQYSGRSTQRRKIVEVMDSSTIRLVSKVPYESSGVGYRIVSGTTGNTDQLGKVGFLGNVELTDTQEGDYLTVWGDPSVGVVRSSSQESLTPKGIGWLTFDPKIISDRKSLYFTTITGGSKDYGRYLLLDYLNDTLSVDDTIDTLTLHVAEVIHKHGEVISTVREVEGIFSLSSPAAWCDGDGDGDTDTSIIDFGSLAAVNPAYQHLITEMRVGDKITLTYTVVGSAEDATVPVFTQATYVTWLPTIGGSYDVTTTPDPHKVLVYPEVPVTHSFLTGDQGEAELHTTPPIDGVGPGIKYGVTGWVIERTPISFALGEVRELKAQIQALQDLVDNYTVDVSDAVGSVLEVLSENGMDRAIELLLNGKLSEFFGMEASDASFAAAAKAAIQTAGRILAETDNG